MVGVASSWWCCPARSSFCVLVDAAAGIVRVTAFVESHGAHVERWKIGGTITLAMRTFICQVRIQTSVVARGNGGCCTGVTVRPAKCIRKRRAVVSVRCIGPVVNTIDCAFFAAFAPLAGNRRSIGGRHGDSGIRWQAVL